jgi:hypothetical protein
MFDPGNPKPLTDPGQIQFRLPLNGYCTDGGLQAIRKLSVEKSAFARYDKGVVDPITGKITPLTLGSGIHGKKRAQPDE